jgi:hypothetical protein
MGIVAAQLWREGGLSTGDTTQVYIWLQLVRHCDLMGIFPQQRHQLHPEIAAEFGVTALTSQSLHSASITDSTTPVSSQELETSILDVRNGDSDHMAGLERLAMVGLNPLFEPAPPYTPTGPAVDSASQLSVVNNFYFASTQSTTGPQASPLLSLFGPALTVGLLSLNIPQSKWQEVQKCVEHMYAEHVWPDILMLCGVPDSHILYIVGLINAENAVTL